MLHEKGPAAGVHHVLLAQVVKRAGLTTGAAYRLWRDQSEFHGDLAVAAMRWQDRSMLDRTTLAASAVVESGGSIDELLRVAGAANVQHMPTDSGIMTTLALRAAAQGNPMLLHASRERSGDMALAFRNLYVGLLHRFRLRLRPGLTIDHLAAGMSALVDGFAVQTASGEHHPELDLPGREEPWTLLAVCLQALVQHFTEPDVDDASQ